MSWVPVVKIKVALNFVESMPLKVKPRFSFRHVPIMKSWHHLSNVNIWYASGDIVHQTSVLRKNDKQKETDKKACNEPVS